MKVENPYESVPLIPITNLCIPGTKSRSEKAFQKRRKAKAITRAMAGKLMALDSEMKPGYVRALICNEYLFHEGNKVTANYCNHRMCNVCNRIKAAKAIKGYMPELLTLDDPHFVTLTKRNVIADELSNEITVMGDGWRKIYLNLKKNYKHLDLRGLRKLESTHNYKAFTFNPHFHIVVNDKELAETILRLWLQMFPESTDRSGQDIQKVRRVEDGSVLLELFKYVVKPVAGKNYSPKAMDTIYSAMKHRKTYFPFGIKKVSVEVEDLRSEKIDFKGEMVEVWKWVQGKENWYSPSGEPFLPGAIPKKTQGIIDVVNSSPGPDVSKPDLNAIYQRQRGSPEILF